MRARTRADAGHRIGRATGQGMSGKLIAYLRRRGRDVSRFGRACDGSYAVEFALVAPILLATVIAILEISYYLFAQQTLQTAAVEFGRLFMTNQGPSQNSTVNASGQLQPGSSVCNIIQPLLNCASVMVNVIPYQNYSSADTSMPTLTYNGQGAVSNSWQYTPGSPGQVVVVQLVYQLTVLPGPLGFVLKNLSNGQMEVMGITAILVEPS
jgi:Flp pilus assembly protein TadG